MKTLPRPRIKALPEADLTSRTIQRAYSEWSAHLGSYRILQDYYLGAFPPSLVTANQCRYITDTKTYFTSGLPTQYTHAVDDEDAMEIEDLFHTQNKPLLDQRITRGCSIFGRCNELVFLDEGGSPKSSYVSPLDGFVAFAPEMDGPAVFGAVHYSVKEDDSTTTHLLDIYTSTDVTRYRQSMRGSEYGWTAMSDPVPHGFGRVPLIEYQNNDYALGDFEQCIALQDAINSLLSDRQADKDKFAQDYMVLKGFLLGEDDEEQEDAMERLKKKKLLQISGDDADISYLTKTYDEAGVQVLMDEYLREVHKTAFVPDMSDKEFGTASGVAIRYKLLGLQDLAQGFVSQFGIGYTRRCKLYAKALNLSPDISQMRALFKFNIPSDLTYESQSLTTLVTGGIISERTARENCTLIEDADAETEEIEAQRAARAQIDKSVYEDDFTGSLMRLEDA
ncbi:MAG: phage portal protein [Gudongella sp.]|jgi:SPP1 family phage portal protein|nr:phage portal protein [Gudongella sp.]